MKYNVYNKLTTYDKMHNTMHEMYLQKNLNAQALNLNKQTKRNVMQWFLKIYTQL